METAAPRSRSRRPNKNPMRAGLVVGIVLGKSGCSSVHALVSGASVAAAPSFVRGYSAPPPPRQSSALSLGRGRVRRRQGDCRLSATGGSGGAGDMDSSELYADMRRRLEEIRRGSAAGPPAEEDVSDLGLYQRREDGGGDGGGGNDGDFPKGGGGSAAGVKAYSAQEMKQRYYEAFWRARNLHKDAKFEGNSSSGAQDSSSASPPATPPPPPKARQAAASRTTMLTPMAMKMFQSGSPAPAPAAADPAAAASSSVQGLTQMYYLVEEDQEEEAATAGVGATAAGSAGPAGGGPEEADGANVWRRAVKREPILPARQAGVMAAAAAAAAAPAVGSPKAGNQEAVAFSSKEAAAAAVSETGAGAGAGADGMSFASAEPQGLTQVFYLDPEEEAEAAAALPVVPGRSFLRERLGVPGEVVQDLRQVELDHARLAMLAVLLSGAVGAGAGAGAGVYMNAHDGFSALADVARTPWLDPYVAGGILAAKALSEGDWRIGKGALAGWADRALSSLSNTGARVLRVGSGNEIRRLAVEMEVKHGRLALGAVVCAMAQQGMLTVAA